MLPDAPAGPFAGQVGVAVEQILPPSQDVFQVQPLSVRHQQGVAIQAPVPLTQKSAHDAVFPSVTQGQGQGQAQSIISHNVYYVK
jgi:hypothetical protein